MTFGWAIVVATFIRNNTNSMKQMAGIWIVNDFGIFLGMKLVRVNWKIQFYEFERV